MAVRAGLQLYRKLEQNLTDKKFLRKTGMSKQRMLSLLAEDNWKEKASFFAEQGCITCTEVMEAARRTLNRISEEPKQGWLSYIYEDTIWELFPDGMGQQPGREYREGKLFLLEVLRTLFAYEEKTEGFSPLRNMELLKDEEIAGSVSIIFWNSCGLEKRSHRTIRQVISAVYILLHSMWQDSCWKQDSL